MAALLKMDAKTSGTWGEWAQDGAVQSALWAARRLPYERRVRMFGAIARHGISAFGGFRKRMLDNLDYVWPDMPEDQRKDIATRTADNIGRALIEHYSMAELADRMAPVAPTGPGVEALNTARSEGRPVILITGHYGSYESGWTCLTANGLPLGGFYRPMANPYTNRHYVAAAQSLGSGPLFAQGRQGMGQMLRYLKTGGSAIILNDLYVGNGIEMDFLGKPARTGLSAAEIALKRNAALIPFYGIRQPDGVTFAVEIEEPIPASDPQTMTAAFNRSLEARILSDPSQWFWIHRRWKRKWNKGKGLEGDPHPAALPRRKS